MGMYTELLLKCDLRDKNRLDHKEKAVLEYLFNDGPEPEELPEHVFFTKWRWGMIGRCSSYYHHPKGISSLVDGDYLFSRSDLKNYDQEIQHFLDWFRPLTSAYGHHTCIGWTWYEEEDEPTLIYGDDDLPA